MNQLQFYRLFGHSEVWPDFLSSNWTISVPEGYDLIENTDHKKKRLENEIKGHETRLEYLESRVMKEKEQLKAKKKELEEL